MNDTDIEDTGAHDEDEPTLKPTLLERLQQQMAQNTRRIVELTDRNTVLAEASLVLMRADPELKRYIEIVVKAVR